MTVKELIETLKAVEDKNSKVFYVYEDLSTGCDTCGYGANQIEADIKHIDDLEGKIWLT